MAYDGERHQMEKVQAAQRRAAAAERGEITRTTPPGGEDTQFRSRLDANLSVSTTPDWLIDNWPGIGAGTTPPPADPPNQQSGQDGSSGEKPTQHSEGR